MNITIKLHHGQVLQVVPPYPDADHGIVLGRSCVGCLKTPFKVAGSGKRISADDRAYEADAIALCCGGYVGVLRAETSTLFGLREDEAIARLGVRIY